MWYEKQMALNQMIKSLEDIRKVSKTPLSSLFEQAMVLRQEPGIYILLKCFKQVEKQNPDP